MPFSSDSDLVETRARLRALVDDVIAKLASGLLPTDVEREHLDIKEEAGRRGSGGLLLPGQARNLAAADQLAHEVTCFANTPGGGVLLVGVEDSTGNLLGAGLDAEWLRHRIYERVDIAPLVEERIVDGVRVIVIFVAESREPVEDADGNLRWRVGRHCVPVDRAEWWLHRQDNAGADPMAAATQRTVVEVAPGAIAAARRYLREATDAGDSGPPGRADAELLRWLGVLRPDGRLTQAGALTFCQSETTLLSLAVIDVEGGDVLAAAVGLSGLSLLEQVAAVESRLDVLNDSVTIAGAFAETAIRRLPPRAVREAILNGVVHRDWMQVDPVAITWIDADSALQVVSPGGFVGGISAGNALTQRYARYPALADLFRALRLVDKQGMGVDRMVREMIALGHRPPVLAEERGPRVRVRLTGGVPVVPVMDLMERIRPVVRRRDVRIALVVYTLLHEPFVSPATLVDVLQRPEAECAEAIDAAAECLVGDKPLLRPYKDVWLLSEPALAVVIGSGGGRLEQLRRRGALAYWRPDNAVDVASAWFASHDRITSGDYAAMAGFTQPGALRQLDRLAAEGLVHRGDEVGRNAHFGPEPALMNARQTAGTLEVEIVGQDPAPE